MDAHMLDTGRQPSEDLAPYVEEIAGGRCRIALNVSGLKCAGCIARIERALKALPGLDEARVNFSTSRVVATWRPGEADGQDIIETVRGLGFAARPFDPHLASLTRDKELRKLLLCLGVAAFAAMNIMLLSVSVWAGVEMGTATRSLLHWVSALIAIPAVAYAGRPFFESALSALKAGEVNMDVPISLAVLLAVGVSLYETMAGGHDTYFDASVMLLFFLLIGRVANEQMKSRARNAAQALLDHRASVARLVTEDGSVREVPVRELLPGDLMVVAPGEKIAVDGVVESGVSELDTSLMTGESLPRAVEAGSEVHGGTLNLIGVLTVRASATESTSLVADMVRLIEAGERSRARIVKLADLAARVYVPVVHLLAAASFLGWLFLGAGVREAVLIAAAVLIITCPCALGLAVPAVQVVATGRLFRAGILSKSGDALERLAQVTHVVFDKTGTLTAGRPRLVNGDVIAPPVLAEAAALARASRHPLSQALATAAGPGKAAGEVEEIPGKGLQAGGRRLGSAAHCGVKAPTDHLMALWYRDEKGEVTRFVFEDALRPDAKAALEALAASGLTLELLSGDRPEVVAATVAGLPFSEVKGGLTPQGKIARLEALKAAGARVLMVGDGINDAPALAAAHISMSPASAADVSQTAADLVFQGQSLAAVPNAYHIAVSARRRILENFGLAALYNACAMPLAAFGFVTPLIAAIAMSGSSLVVTANAMRVARARPLESDPRRTQPSADTARPISGFRPAPEVTP